MDRNQESPAFQLLASGPVGPPIPGRSALALSPGLWLLLYTSDKSCLCLPCDPGPRQAEGQSLEEGLLQKRGTYKKSGRRRWTGAAGGQPWGCAVRRWGF